MGQVARQRYGLETAADVQHLKYARHMNLDRSFGQTQALRDLLVRMAVAHQFQDLALPRENRSFIKYEHLTVPLAADGTNVDMLFGVRCDVPASGIDEPNPSRNRRA